MEQVYAASASSLIRRRVKNPRGESLGRIEELVIDLNRGFIAYAVLGFAEWVGQSRKRFVVPWGSLRMDPTDRSFVLDVPRETFSSAAGMDTAEASPRPTLHETVGADLPAAHERRRQRP